MPQPKVVARPPLLLPELGPAEPVQIAAVPPVAQTERGWLSSALPGLSALGIVGFALLSPHALIIAISLGLAVLGAVLAGWSARRQRRRQERTAAARSERYRSHLARQRKILMAAALRQRAHAAAVHPPPALAEQAARAGLVWERRPGHADFLRVRLGVGRAVAHRPPRGQPANGDCDSDPELLAEAAATIAHFSAVDEVPLAVDLAPESAGKLTVLAGCGLPLVRALVVSLARAHGPDVLRLHALATSAELRWLGMLPQAGSVTADPDELLAAVRTQLREDDHRQQVVLVGLGSTGVDAEFVAALMRLNALSGGRQPAGMSVVVAAPEAPAVGEEPTLVTANNADGSLVIATPGPQPRQTAVAVADAITYRGAVEFAASLSRCVLAGREGPRPTSALRLATLLTPPAHPLVLPLGQDDDGATVRIDLREAAAGGDGPHGLVIGATGSGKSELLRTLIAAAAVQSSPRELAFLLIDYKGGAAFAELARLPHTAGLLTNLSSDPHAVDRLCASLRAEVERRQRELRAAGADDIDAYQADAAHPSMPRLLVVVDEYAELIEQSPDMLDVLTSIGRLGRSLGVHLLLSSQRVDDGRLRGLDAHLRFRICLRTYAAAESVAAIGSAVAAQLPARPGCAWLRRDDRLTRLQVATVSDPAAAVDEVITQLASSDCGAAAFGSAQPICLPPLPDALSLSPWAEGTEPGNAKAIVGLVDLPHAAQQLPLLVDLAGPGGHLAVVGAPGSGRSTALATVVAALAGTTPPRDLAVHVITSPSSVLTALAGLPHVGTVATNRELALQVVGAVSDIVAERRISERRDSSRIVLVLDDLGSLRADDDLAAGLTTIVTEGLAVGVSLAVSGGRWSDLRGGIREAMGSRWELRLNDVSESLQPSLARTLAQRPPGRILTETGRWAQVALPRVDGVDSAQKLPEALADLVAAIARRGGPATRPVQLLPRMVPAESLPRPSRGSRLPIGVHGAYAEPLEVSLAAGEHLIVLGNSASGRSGFLRAVAAAARARGAELWTIDPRRTLAITAHCATSAAEAAALTAELSAMLLAGPAAATAPPPRVLIVDDLELMSGRSAGIAPLSPILELLPHAADLGLSIVACRRVSGFAKGAFDPFFGQLLDLCETSVVLSGDPAEGAVVGGVRPRPQPPGRGHLVVKGQLAGQVQLAWLGRPPAESVAAVGLHHCTEARRAASNGA